MLPISPLAWADACRLSMERERQRIADAGGVTAHWLTLRVGWSRLSATLLDNDTAHDFLELLPLRLKLRDVLDFAKSANLPRAISESGPRLNHCEPGDVVYWPPGRAVGIYYQPRDIPAAHGDVIAIGRIDAGLDRLLAPLAINTRMRVTARPADF